MRTNNSKIRISTFQNIFLKYFEVFKINYRETSTYFVAIISRSITVVFRVWVFTQLYTMTFSSNNVSEVNGFTVASTIWCLSLVQTIQSASRPEPSTIIEDEVKSGSLAYSINKPYSFFLFHLSSMFGRIFPRLIFILIPTVLITYFFVGGFNFTPIGLFAAIILQIMGYTINYMMSFIIGLLAFWIEDIRGVIWIYNKSKMVLGGSIFPLALFPDTFRQIAELLPFGQFFYSSSRILVKFDLGLFERYLGIQLAWALIFGILAYVLFNFGIKKVSINGG